MKRPHETAHTIVVSNVFFSYASRPLELTRRIHLISSHLLLCALFFLFLFPFSISSPASKSSTADVSMAFNDQVSLVISVPAVNGGKYRPRHEQVPIVSESRLFLRSAAQHRRLSWSVGSLGFHFSEPAYVSPQPLSLSLSLTLIGA